MALSPLSGRRRALGERGLSVVDAHWTARELSIRPNTTDVIVKIRMPALVENEKTLPELLRNISACTYCADALPCGPRPVLQAHTSARLRIVSQAPGRKVHETGIPWNDPSGDRLRDWLGLTREQFYDPCKVAILPIAFCYPGKAASGDKSPRRECAPRWHSK